MVSCWKLYSGKKRGTGEVVRASSCQNSTVYRLFVLSEDEPLFRHLCNGDEASFPKPEVVARECGEAAGYAVAGDYAMGQRAACDGGGKGLKHVVGPQHLC